MVLRSAFVVCALLVLGAGRSGAQPATAPVPTAGTVLVTGGNRGLGLELVKQYAARSWRVIATARDPASAVELQAVAKSDAHVTVETLDLLDDAAIAALAAKYRGTPIDVLLNNAGVLGDLDAQQLGSLDYAEFAEVMRVNAYAPLAMAQAFVENVASSREKKIVSMTSRSGIVSLPGWRGPYFYRASKIALNMQMRVLADDLRPRGIVVALVAPPPTDTEMLRALAGTETAARQARPADSIAGVIKVIDGLTVENSAQPLYFDGTPLPW